MPRGLRPTLLALPPLLAATAVAAAPLSIPIGAVNSLTGRSAAAIHLGILLVVEEANAGGGMGGRPARLLVQGDAGRIVEEGPVPVLLQAPGVRKALLGA